MQIVYNPFTGSFDFVGAGGSGTSPAPRYTNIFNSTTDWTLASPDYTLTIPAATHGKGAHPTVSIFEDIGGGVYQQTMSAISVFSSGDVVVKVSSTPDNRFSGLILII